MKTKTATPKSSRKAKKPKDNSLAAQRQCVLEALQKVSAGLTTIELRERYDVMMPAARVHELRWSYGYNIGRAWVHDTNAQGHRHSVVRYVLHPGKWRKAP